MEITETVEHTVTLARIRSPAAWTAFSVPAFPDESERRSVTSMMRSLASKGVDYAVLNATDEVSQASGGADIAHLISVSSSSRSGGPYGGLLAWPWSSDSDLAAHGAVDWRGLDAADLHALMSKSGRRNTAVTTEWVASAGPPHLWDPEPTRSCCARPRRSTPWQPSGMHGFPSSPSVTTRGSMWPDAARQRSCEDSLRTEYRLYGATGAPHR